MQPKNLLFVIRHSSYGLFPGREILDAILAASAYGQNIQVLFMDEGIWQLKSDQQANLIAQKSVEKNLAAFEIYEIEDLFVCERSALERGISADNISVDAQWLNTASIRTLLSKQDQIVSF